MSGSGDSSGTIKAADAFEDLWRQLGECHHQVIGELESKVSRLKKDRCLDAQRLEVFYNRNQQLKEENKTLHDTIHLLEERLQTEECVHCVVLEEKLKSSLDQNIRLLNELRVEKDNLQDENRTLRAEIQKLKASCSSSEQDDGFIPDSPVLPSSLPPASKLRKRKQLDQQKHVRYEEKPLPHPRKSLLREPPRGTENAGKAEVLVPNTCELDTPQMADDREDGEVVAETCALQPVGKHLVKKMFPSNQQSSSKPLLKYNVCVKPHCFSSSTRINSPDSTTKKSPSLLPYFKRFADDAPEEPMDDNGDESQERAGGKALKPEQISSRKVQSSDSGARDPKPSSAFRIPIIVTKRDGGTEKRTSLRNSNISHCQPGAKQCRKLCVEPAWSIDPALALSSCGGELEGEEDLEEKQHGGELMDTDCTWVSHSMLQRPGQISQDSKDIKPSLGAKAVDSLDMMFDTTAYGEYQSCSSLPINQSQHDDDDDDDDEEDKHYEDDELDSPDNHAHPNKAQATPFSSREPAFAHVAVVRKKDERRKLKGTTCKECEIYYAYLPEEDKQKKLSACSRHRYLYIPPCTPENFWEVGFPSTQTCIDRGYIKEEKSSSGRMRRRQPLNALFTPKKKEQSPKST